jgi:casein kinase I family protein HRR25
MAMKVEIEEDDHSMLEKEIKVLIEMRYLHNYPRKKTGFPQIKFYG